MNQILSTQSINNKKKNKSYNGGRGPSGPKDINSILKFFSVMLIVFGGLLIGNGVLALNGNGATSEKQETTKPQITLEKKDDDKVLITVLDEADIDNVMYQWNDEDEQSIQGASGKMVQKVLDLPEGENLLQVTALNVNGGSEEISKTFKLDTAISINISISGNNIKVVANSKTDIEKISYAWDDEEEKEVEVGDKTFSMQLVAEIGEHTINVVVTDENGVTKKASQKVTGTTKPKVQVTKGQGAYHIIASDEIGLNRVEITTMNDGKIKKISTDGKDFEYDFPLTDGDDNFIKIVAINTNNVESDPVKVKWPKKAQ